MTKEVKPKNFGKKRRFGTVCEKYVGNYTDQEWFQKMESICGRESCVENWIEIIPFGLTL